jgi:hypothetical protein
VTWAFLGREAHVRRVLHNGALLPKYLPLKSENYGRRAGALAARHKGGKRS